MLLPHVAWIILILPLQCTGIGLEDSQTTVVETFDAILQIIGKCWKQKPAIIVFPHPLTDSFFSEIERLADNVVFVDASSVPDITKIPHMAKRNLANYIILGDIDLLISFVKANLRDVMASTNQITWLLSEHVANGLDLKNVRFDSLLLSFSKHPSPLTVYEVYGFKNKHVSWNEIGSKSVNSNLLCTPNNGTVQRRTSILKGQDLQYAYVTPLFKDIEEVLKMGREQTFFSPSMIIREQLLDIALHTQLVLQENHIYDVDPHANNGNAWTSLLNVLGCNNTIEFVGESFGSTVERLQKVDFTKSAYIDKARFFTSSEKVEYQLDASNYLKLFSPPLWLAIFLTYSLIGVALALFDLHFQDRSNVSSLPLLLIHWWSLLFLELLQRPTLRLPSNIAQEFNSSRAIFLKHCLIFIISLMSFVLFSLYSSNLTSVVANSRGVGSEFNELSDLLSPSVHLRVLSPFALSYFKENKRDAHHQAIFSSKFSNLKNEGLITDAQMFLSTHDQGVVFGELTIENTNVLKTQLKEVLKNFSKISSLAIPVRKNSELNQMLNHYILKLTEAGCQRWLEKKWLPLGQFDTQKASPIVVRVHNVQVIFYVIATGMTLSICLVLLECVCFYYRIFP